MEVALYSSGNINIIAESSVVFDLFQLINDNTLIDRLYKRYVRPEDNNKTLNILESKAKIIHNNLLEKLIEKFAKGIEGSNLDYEIFGGDYYPIRLGIGDTFFSMVEEEIPLEDYDNLEGDPLWMRPEYMLEKYGK